MYYPTFVTFSLHSSLKGFYEIESLPSYKDCRTKTKSRHSNYLTWAFSYRTQSGISDKELHPKLGFMHFRQVTLLPQTTLIEIH